MTPRFRTAPIPNFLFWTSKTKMISEAIWRKLEYGLNSSQYLILHVHCQSDFISVDHCDISSHGLTPFRLKHDNLILQQWKTEVGMVAVETANTLNSQIEIVEQSSQQYQLELEGIQLENQSMSQQIKAYRDEVCHTTNCEK